MIRALRPPLLPVEYAARLRAPFAVLGIRTRGDELTGVEYLARTERAQAPRNDFAAEVVRQIEAYLRDPAFQFSLPLAPEGTAFQRAVWQAIDAIPVGESRTYGEIARLLHTGPRAIGGACGHNPIALVTPCHRVVGARGSLGGFGGGGSAEALAIKRWLLVHEGYRFGA